MAILDGAEAAVFGILRNEGGGFVLAKTRGLGEEDGGPRRRNARIWVTVPEPGNPCRVVNGWCRGIGIALRGFGD
jgi:hypothetical protein